MSSFRLALGVAAWTTAIGCVLPAASTPAAALGEPDAAEFALRWNAREGGPATAEATLNLLSLRAKHATRFEVSYYDLPSTIAAPPGFSTILRRRQENGGEAELTFKLRGDHALTQWSCPLRDAGPPKAEMDFTFGVARTPARTFSYSCTQTGADRAANELSATPKACGASVIRREAGKLKVEEWRLPGDVLMIEVSGRGADSTRAMEKFRERVVTPLLAAGVRPAADSKTEFGSRCL